MMVAGALSDRMPGTGLNDPSFSRLNNCIVSVFGLEFLVNVFDVRMNSMRTDAQPFSDFFIR